jgi:hypothetical protein
VNRPRARHLVLVVAGAVLIGTGLALPHGQPRVDAADFTATAPTSSSAAPSTPVPSPTPPAPPAPVVPPVAAAPATVSLPGTPDPVPLEPVGVLESGALQLPERPTVLGWFAAGVAPGDPAGTAVIAGHIDSAEYGAGPLEGLVTLAAGDVVTVTDATGVAHRFAITSRASYPKSAGGVPAETFRRDGPPQLALVTCGGAFDERTGDYADNVVVLATPAP